MIYEILESGKHGLLLLVIPSIFVVAGVFLFVVRQMLRKRLEPAARALGSKIVMNFLQSPYIPVHDHGGEARISVTPGGRNSPPFLILKDMTPVGFTLSISKENPITRGLGRLGILKDVEIGDALFDKTYVVRSSDPVMAQNFLQHPSRRDMTEWLFAEGFTQIRADKAAFMIMKPNYQKEDLNRDRMLFYLERMRKLVSG